jgi:hypothetical protein
MQATAQVELLGTKVFSVAVRETQLSQMAQATSTQLRSGARRSH